jgi:hypothetical protein
MGTDSAVKRVGKQLVAPILVGEYAALYVPGPGFSRSSRLLVDPLQWASGHSPAWPQVPSGG